MIHFLWYVLLWLLPTMFVIIILFTGMPCLLSNLLWISNICCFFFGLMLVFGSMFFEMNVQSRLPIVVIASCDFNISAWSKLTTHNNGVLHFSPSFFGVFTFGYNFTTFIHGASNINTIGDEVPTITSLWIQKK